MTIGIFANQIILEKAGVGRYAYHLVKEILKADKKNHYILLANFVRKGKQRRAALEQFVKSTGNTNTEIFVTRMPDAWRDWLYGSNFPVSKLYPKKIDLFFALFPTNIPKNGWEKEFCVIHDLVYEKYPETMGKKFVSYYRERTQNAVLKSRVIFCDSRSTQDDLVGFLPVAKGKAEVVYPGPTELNQARATLPEGLKNKRYILNVGTLEPRKNLENLLRGYAGLPERLKVQYPLVLVGAKGWQEGSIFKTVQEENLTRFVKFLGFVPDETLSKLYAEAKLFVYPSLYEGFGLPVLEAMQYETPVITSNVSSLPEVAGRGAIYIDPLAPNEITRAIQKVLEGKADLNELKSAAAKHIAQFSWEKSAQKVISTFDRFRDDAKSAKI